MISSGSILQQLRQIIQFEGFNLNQSDSSSCRGKLMVVVVPIDEVKSYGIKK